MKTQNQLAKSLSALGMILMVAVVWGTMGCDRAPEETAVADETKTAEERLDAAFAQALLRDASEEAETRAVLRGPYPVVRVVDSETIEILQEGKEEKIRLLSIDAPDPGQPGYAEAEACLRSLVGRDVSLSYDVGKERDRNGLRIAVVLSSDQNVNLEMIRAGWSPYRAWHGHGMHFDSQYRQAEQQAKAEGRGIWKKGNP